MWHLLPRRGSRVNGLPQIVPRSNQAEPKDCEPVRKNIQKRLTYFRLGLLSMNGQRRSIMGELRAVGSRREAAGNLLRPFVLVASREAVRVAPPCRISSLWSSP